VKYLLRLCKAYGLITNTLIAIDMVDAGITGLRAHSLWTLGSKVANDASKFHMDPGIMVTDGINNLLISGLFICVRGENSGASGQRGESKRAQVSMCKRTHKFVLLSAAYTILYLALTTPFSALNYNIQYIQKICWDFIAVLILFLKQ
jgi:hypothetical protein